MRARLPERARAAHPRGIDARLVAGAEMEARGALIGDGTAIADATAFGQWRAAERPLERGAYAACSSRR